MPSPDHSPSRQEWYDEQRAKAGDALHLTLWRPLPPAGYVALGMAAWLGPLPPPAGTMRCVRADVALRNEIERGRPSWAHPEFKQRIPVFGWITDERLSTFLALSQVGESYVGYEQSKPRD